MYHDSNTSNIKKGYVSDFPFLPLGGGTLTGALGKVGTLTGAASTATVATSGLINIVQTLADSGDTLDIRLTDDDLSSTDTPSVTVVSTTDTDGEIITLVWDNTNSYFEGTVVVSSNPGFNVVNVAEGDTITASYSDSNPVVTVSDQCTLSTTAIISFEPILYMDDTNDVYLVDPDLSQTTTPVVHIISDSDVEGIDVTLTWASSISKFAGSFLTDSGTNTVDVLYVSGGDLITATHTDSAPNIEVSETGNICQEGSLSFAE